MSTDEIHTQQLAGIVDGVTCCRIIFVSNTVQILFFIGIRLFIM